MFLGTGTDGVEGDGLSLAAPAGTAGDQLLPVWESTWGKLRQLVTFIAGGQLLYISPRPRGSYS